MRSIVFDPWKNEPGREPWGPQAWVTTDFMQWQHVVKNTRNCVVIWDEATTHGGDDEENAGFFTEIRHRHPVLYAMGHCHSALDRKMRVNLTDLYLALSDKTDAMLWARTMKDEALNRAAEETFLPKYHFAHKRPFEPVRVVNFSPAQIRAGICP